MTSFIQQGDNIIINGVKFTLDLFLQLEPNYEVVSYRLYEPEKTHTIINKGNQSGGPINWDDGDRFIKRISDLKYLNSQNEIDETENQAEIELSKQEHLDYKVKRQDEYPLTEEMVIALWEHLIERKSKTSSGVSKIQTKREKIKKDFPKQP